MIKKPLIKTKRLILRPFEANDLETMHEYASDIENTKYMIHLPNNSLNETAQFLQRVVTEWAKDSPKFYEFAIILDKKHIGAVSVYLNETRQEGELGWIIHKAYHSNGYATEAAKEILEFALKTLNVKKIIAHCDYRNKTSIRVMQKIGLFLERDDGVRCYKDNNENIQEYMYSLIVNETVL